MSRGSKSAINRIAKRKRRFRAHSTIGTDPGTLLSHPTSGTTTVRVITYDGQACDELTIEDIHQLKQLVSGKDTEVPATRRNGMPWSYNQQVVHPRVYWINLDGLGNTKLIKQIGELLRLHRLALEDAVNVHQRAKFEAYGETLFFVARTPYGDESTFATEQVSLFLCGNVVLTMQERRTESLDGLRSRITSGAGRVIKYEADYLTYAILDAIVDSYFTRLEAYGSMLDSITPELGTRYNRDTPLKLHTIRSGLLEMRRVVRQQRDAMQQVVAERYAAVSDETLLYFRDCLDHLNQLLDATDAERETCAELRELYFALLGQHNNDVIKLLTIISSIFIPMSFIASVYGMNFDPEVSPFNMPELGWYLGYPFAIGMMLVVAVGLLWYLGRKGWLR
jgi:magnesium transporter